MTITREFKLCLNAGTASAPFINVNQYDEGEEWYFSLYHEDGSSYTPSSGAIIGLKADNNAILNAGSVVAGKVLITETQQMTAAAGRAIYELLIDGETHGTANFIVNVERRPSDDAEFSDSDLSMLQEAIDAAEVINEILDEGGDPSEIITENVNAWLDNHPEATTTVLDGTITAPKINNSLWDKILVNEEVSGNPASFEDGADDVPVSSLKVALEPVQTGSGDPSPTNIRPIVASNGKNLLQITATSQTVNGVTFTVNTDGTVKANGTASSAAEFVIKSDVSGNTYAGMILSGCPNGGGGSTYRLFEQVQGSPWTYLASDGGGGATLPTTTYATVRFIIRVESGVSVNNLVFKPMIRLASITDSTYQPYQGIMVERTGKNLLDGDDFVTRVLKTRCSATKIADGEFVVTASESGNSVWIGQGVSVGQQASEGRFAVVKAKKNDEFIATGAPSILFYEFDKDRYVLSIQSATNGYYKVTNDNCAYISFRFTLDENSTSGTTYSFKPMVRYASATNDTFVPYVTPTSYPYTLGQSVYGGTVDLATGVLTVDRGYVDLSSIDWNNADASGWVQQVLTIDDAMFVPNSQVADIYCDVFVKASANDVYNKVHNNSICINSSKKLQIYCTAIASMSDTNIKTYLTGHYLIYPLATPQTIQLTPTEVKTLLGYNNISSSGTVDVIYHADTKLYIDKKIGELS